MCALSKNSINTLGATNVAKSIRQDLDFYQTPSGAVQALVDQGLASKSISVWEPMAGNGAIVEVLKQNGYDVIASDIVKRKYRLDYIGDFFELNSLPDSHEKCDWQVITNPPYSVADKFLVHCLSMKPKFLAVFLPVRYLEGIKRYKETYSKYTPSDVIVFARRYGCYKESDVEAGKVNDHGIGSAVAYMWLCFTRQDDGSYKNETKLHFVY